MISINKDELKAFETLADEFKKLPAKIEAAVKKGGAEAVNGSSAKSALRLALGKDTVKSLDQIITGALEAE